MIDIEFGSARWQTAKEKVVVQKWREYADHLNERMQRDDEASINAWIQRGDDLFVSLLDTIAKALGYDFDRVQLRRGIYYPQAHNEAERRRDLLEVGLMKVLSGDSPLPMAVTSFPVSDEALAKQDKMQNALLAALKGGRLKVDTGAQ